MSTGPRTQAGKTIVSRNAIAFGITAATHRAIPGESPAEMAEFYEQMHTVLAPRGPAETSEVDVIASLYWRSRRITKFEQSVLTRTRELNEQAAANVPTPKPGFDFEIPVEPPSPEVIAGMSMLPRTEYESKLFGHEGHQSRQLNAALARLQTLRALRDGNLQPIIVAIQNALPRRATRKPRSQNKRRRPVLNPAPTRIIRPRITVDAIED